MMRHVPVLILTLVLSATPMAVAGWGAKGSYEPDTLEDRTEYMWSDPASTGVGNRVYFNAWAGFCTWPCVTTSINANVAQLGTAHSHYPMHAYAMLGVWRDCNLDNYIGYGDNALLIYRAELLPEDHICDSSTAGLDDPDWVPSHNDGQWVREFLSIGYDGTANSNPFNLVDDSARVWGDWNRPGDAPQPTCAVLPFSGTFQSTGGTLRWADCMLSWRVTRAVNGIDPTGEMGLGFQDGGHNRPDRSESLLNQQNPWGQEKDDSYATAFDCDAEPQRFQDPTYQSPQNRGVMTNVTVYRPGASTPILVNTSQYSGVDDRGRIFLTYAPASSPTIRPGGSMAGTVNETYEGVGRGGGNCDREDDDGHLLPTVNTWFEMRRALNGHIYAAVEQSVYDSQNVTGKSQHDHVYQYQQGTHSRNLTSAGGGIPHPLGEGTPGDMGHSHISAVGFWNGGTVTFVSRNPYVNRDTLQPMEVTYLTAYASVNQSAIDRYSLLFPGAEPGAYGSEWCSRSPDPALNGGFECNATKWWRGANGEDIRPTDGALRIGVTVDQQYQLRDVDCYDESVNGAREANAHWGRISDTRCVR